MRFLEWWFNRGEDQSFWATLIVGSFLGFLIALTLGKTDLSVVLGLTGFAAFLVLSIVAYFLMDATGHIWAH